MVSGTPLLPILGSQTHPTYDLVYWLPIATVANYQGLGELEQQKFVFLYIVQGVRCWKWVSLG